jgi:hypothetical protein
MIASSAVFFDPAWLRARWGSSTPVRSAAPLREQARRLSVPAAVLIAAYVGLQVIVPLRFLFYPGAVNWTEEAFRFSWRVMLVEKAGQVEYQVLTDAPRRSFVVYPRSELTPLQYKMMAAAPDMIHEYAIVIGDRFRRDGYVNVRVHAHAWAAINGHPSQRLIDPAVDLAAEKRSLAPKDWIIPLAVQDTRLAAY